MVSGSDLSPEAAPFIADLYRGDGRKLVYEPLMDQWLGDDDLITANVQAQSDLYQSAVVQYGEGSLEAGQAKAQLDAMMSLQADPSVRAGVSTITKGLLNATLTDDWEGYIKLVAPKVEGLLSDGEEVSTAVKNSLMDLIDRPGLSPSQKMRIAANWTTTQGYAFKKEGFNDQGAAALNTAARNKYLEVVEKWASATETEQQPVTTEMGKFLALDSGDPYRAQRVFLKMATLESIEDLTSERTSYMSPLEQVKLQSQMELARDEY
jgi:hypothetical protein